MDKKFINKSLCRLLIAFSFVFGFASFVSGTEYSLFTSDLNSSLQMAGSNPLLRSNPQEVKQYRQVSLNPIVSSQSIIKKGDVLDMSLFAGTNYRAMIDKVSTNINGTKTIRGRINEFPLGNVIISIDGNRSLGSIRIPEKNEFYLIQYESTSRAHYLLNMDINKLDILQDEPSPTLSLPVSQQSSNLNMLATTLASNPLDTVTLDVMIVYTPAARTWANSYASSIGNVIAQAVASGQLALDNSNTYLNLNLVYSGEVNYTESGNSATDLERMTYKTDGYMDEVHTLRDQYHADVVALFSKADDTGGISWLLENKYGLEFLAFSLVRVQQAATPTSYTYIHELAHNMGCSHHKEQTVQPGPGIFSYSAGWRWTGDNNGKYCSVMSYTSGSYFPDGIDHIPVAYFSNPNVLYKGVATGDSANGDNARTIREIKSVVANYRNDVSITYIDIGLRYYDGTQIVKVACEPQGTLTSPLRISKNGITYGIALVEIGDPDASGIIIQTSSGPKAIRKL